MVSTIDGGHYLGLSMTKKRRRRIWEDEEKRRIVAQTRVPGVSVSQVARRYDVNANMVFKWLRDPRFMQAEDELRSFLPVEVLPDASPGAAMSDGDAVASDCRIEITLSNGLSLCVSGGFDPDAVSRLSAAWRHDPGSDIDEDLACGRGDGHAQGVCRLVSSG